MSHKNLDVDARDFHPGGQRPVPLGLLVMLAALGLEHQNLLALGLGLDHATHGGAADVRLAGFDDVAVLHEQDAVERDLCPGLAVHPIDDHDHSRFDLFLPAAGLNYREHGDTSNLQGYHNRTCFVLLLRARCRVLTRSTSTKHQHEAPARSTSTKILT